MQERNNTIDLARLFCAYGVIVTHISASTISARKFQLFFHNFHVPFFYLTAIALFSFKINRGLNEVLNKILNRLIIPYLIWTLVYVILLICKGAIDVYSISLISLCKIIFYGESAVHLYFVPQLIFMQLLMYSLFNLLRKRKIITNTLLLIICLLFFGFGKFSSCFGNTSFLGIIFYLGVGYLVRNFLRNSNNNYKILLSGLMLFLAVMYFTYNSSNNFFFNLPWGGLSLVLICGGITISKLAVPSIFLSMSYATFGIYLIHICYVEGLGIIQGLLFGVLENNLMHNVIYSILVLLLSYFTYMILNKINITRYLFLGNGCRK